MKDFIMCKISAIYNLYFKCKKTITVIPISILTMKKKGKNANILEFITVWKSELE